MLNVACQARTKVEQNYQKFIVIPSAQLAQSLMLQACAISEDLQVNHLSNT